MPARANAAAAASHRIPARCSLRRVASAVRGAADAATPPTRPFEVELGTSLSGASREECARLRALGRDVEAGGLQLGLGLGHAHARRALDLVLAGLVDELAPEVCMLPLGHHGFSSNLAPPWAASHRAVCRFRLSAAR